LPISARYWQWTQIVPGKINACGYRLQTLQAEKQRMHAGGWMGGRWEKGAQCPGLRGPAAIALVCLMPKVAWRTRRTSRCAPPCRAKPGPARILLVRLIRLDRVSRSEQPVRLCVQHIYVC